MGTLEESGKSARHQSERDGGGWALLLYVIRNGWLVAFVAVACAVAGGAYAFLSTPWFKSEVVITPADEKNAASGLGQLGGLAGLAGLAGVDLGSSGEEERLAILRSRELASDFISAKNLLPVLFAGKWDALKGNWKSPDSSERPDVREGVDYFLRNVCTISQDSRTNLVTVSIRWKDAEAAAEWANDLVSMANSRIRERALRKAESNIAFLRGEIEKTSVVQLQVAIGQVMQSELQKLMLARGTTEYAFSVVDRATPARRKFRPQRALLVVMSGLSGALLAVVGLFLFREARRNLSGL